jgi:hypothetical protein
MNAQDRTFYQSLLNRDLGSDGFLADHREQSHARNKMKDQIHNLLNKAAIVTGASREIGAIIASSEYFGSVVATIVGAVTPWPER